MRSTTCMLLIYGDCQNLDPSCCLFKAISFHGTQDSDWQRDLFSILEKVNIFFILTQMATHSRNYPVVCFSHLTKVLGACSDQYTEGFLIFFVAMWFDIQCISHQFPNYEYLRGFQYLFIRNWVAIFNFKHIPFCTWEDKYRIRKVLLNWKMCVLGILTVFAKSLYIEVYQYPFLPAIDESSDFSTLCMLSNSVLSYLLIFSNLTNEEG